MKHKAAFHLQLEQRLLVVTANGVWTLNDAKEYVTAFRKLVQPITNNAWAIIMDASAWQLSPADVFAVLQDNTRWCFEHQLVMAITILPEDQLLRWQFGKATAINKPEGFISEFTSDVATARQMVQAAKVIEDY